MLRITLTSPKYSQITIEKNDPVGINELVLKVKRSSANDGVFFEVVVSLKFIKEAIPFIEQCFANDGGIDALVVVTIYEYDPNTRIWEVYQKGKINFNNYDRSNDLLEVAIEQVNDQSLVLNSIATDVYLDDVNGKTVALHSKSLLRTFKGDINDPFVEYYEMPANGYGVIDFDKVVNEIGTKYTYPIEGIVNDQLPYEMLVCADKGSYHFTFKFRLSTDYNVGTALYGDHTNTSIDLILKAGSNANVTASKANTGTAGVDAVTTYTIDTTLDLEQGDLITIYFKNLTGGTVNFAWVCNYIDNVESVIIEALTTFITTSCDGLLLFEAVERCLQYYTDGKVFLKSTLLGRTDIGYDEDGDAALILWTNGNKIRSKTSKKIFANLERILNFIEAAFCSSFGFETVDGVLYLVVEKKSYFYDNTDRVLLLAGQYDYNITIDSKGYYRQISYGYNVKLDVGLVNASDDFNTLRKINTPVKNTKGTLDITTNVNANGSQIEYQRRLLYKTEDSKMDDESFVIVVKRDGENFVSKQADGYESITGVYDYATGYNYDISPSRMLINWYSYLASIVIYSKSKTLLFASGEGNYQMLSTKTGGLPVAENDDIDLRNEIPIFELFNYNIANVSFNRSQMALLKANPFGYLSFRDKDNVLHHGYIDESGIDHDSNKGTANVKLIKAYKVL
jgi:hypothetical protein